MSLAARPSAATGRSNPGVEDEGAGAARSDFVCSGCGAVARTLGGRRPMGWRAGRCDRCTDARPVKARPIRRGHLADLMKQRPE